MIAQWNPRISGIRRCSANELLQELRNGCSHINSAVATVYCEARHLAAKAVAENADNALIVSALLWKPCQMLACGTFDASDWTSDSLAETGTIEWLCEHFGDEVGETIRLVPHARRFLASVVPEYFANLSVTSQKSVFTDGGFMSWAERQIFATRRFQRNAIQIATWADQGADRWLDLPDVEFFFPFVLRAMSSKTVANQLVHDTRGKSNRFVPRDTW
ncbi:MAG: hypothetical protein ABL921_25390 [Pirellula sp.]